MLDCLWVLGWVGGLLIGGVWVFLVGCCVCLYRFARLEIVWLGMVGLNLFPGWLDLGVLIMLVLGDCFGCGLVVV